MNICQRDTIFKEIGKHLHLNDDKFIPTCINWLPDDRPIQVYMCSFKNALYALLSNKQLLMKEENLSFPDSRTPLSPHQYPECNSTSKMSELHHGEWWRKTWETRISNEILVPIILYMDGISLDVQGKLTLTPLNFTLGIFNTETHIFLLAINSRYT